MAAGISIVRANFDSQIGAMATNIDGSLIQWDQLNAYLVGPGGGFAGIQAAPLSYTDVPGGSGDATHVFGSIQDMEQLFKIYTGAQNLVVAKDFRANLKFLFGLGTH